MKVITQGSLFYLDPFQRYERIRLRAVALHLWWRPMARPCVEGCMCPECLDKRDVRSMYGWTP